MEIQFNIGLPIPTVELTDFPYTSGVITILSPIGTTVYENTDYSSPDFTNPADVVAKNLPFNPSDGHIMEGVYTVTITDDTGGHPSTTYLPELKISPYGLTIQYFQDCSAATVLLNYTSKIPIDAVITSITWEITAPNGTTTQETTPSVLIDPALSGTYQITLTIEFSVTQTQGGAEVSVNYVGFTSTNYINTCGNAQSILCNSLYCCLKTAFYSFITNPNTANLYAMAAVTAAAMLVSLSIMCNKQVEGQEIINKLNTRYPCSPCECGCND
jgi:hypothetical protein